MTGGPSGLECAPGKGWVGGMRKLEPGTNFIFLLIKRINFIFFHKTENDYDYLPS